LDDAAVVARRVRDRKRKRKAADAEQAREHARNARQAASAARQELHTFVVRARHGLHAPPASGHAHACGYRTDIRLSCREAVMPGSCPACNRTDCVCGSDADGEEDPVPSDSIDELPPGVYVDSDGNIYSDDDCGYY